MADTDGRIVREGGHRLLHGLLLFLLRAGRDDGQQREDGSCDQKSFHLFIINKVFSVCL